MNETVAPTMSDRSSSQRSSPSSYSCIYTVEVSVWSEKRGESRKRDILGCIDRFGRGTSMQSVLDGRRRG
jgi:hypothetical protein